MNRREFLKGAAAAAGALAAPGGLAAAEADPLGQRRMLPHSMIHYSEVGYWGRWTGVRFIMAPATRIGHDGIERRVVPHTAFAGAGATGFVRGS